jgi:hypothetical protein
MKTQFKLLFAAALCLQLASAPAQMGRPGGGPQMNAATAKLFGDQQTFSADLEVILNQGQEMTLPGKMAFDNGKARMEMNMGEAKGGAMAQNAAQMKAMGMDQIVMIMRPDQKASYMVVPGMKAYAPAPESDSGSTNIAAFKLENTKLGEETVDGKECVKNKAVVTDDQGKKHEFTVWNAKSLKDFPVKIQMKQEGMDVTTLFKDVKFSKPDSGQFNPPSDFKKYDDFMTMMQQEVMKRMQQQGGGMPAGE